MIDAKYGLKYSMPHSIVHIEDHSMYTGELPTVIADDPSLFSTIVVTGTPMGEDNVVTKLTRSDVAATAYGLGNMTTDDIKRYGQSVTYPLSIINQGAPVQLLRVTPEGSTYGVAVLLVQWRKDPTDNKFHIRFKEANINEEGSDIILERFKNKERLNAALVKQFANNDKLDEDGTSWKQAVFCTFIGAGRGSVYNNFNVAINLVSQNRRPANVKYEFVTIDTRVSSTIERFSASLVNVNNQLRTDYVETVNNTVARRMPGSSIVVPTVNENVVKTIYNEYRQYLTEKINDMTVVDDFTNKVNANLNVNTFDILYGNYIYDGDIENVKLPFLQVDMFDTNIPILPVQYRIETKLETPSSYKPEDPAIIYADLLDKLTTGVKRDGDSVYVGDVYLTTIGTNETKPMLTMVANINQYTGSVTSITVPMVYPLKADDTSTFETNTRPIAVIFNDGAADGKDSIKLKKFIKEGTVKAGDVVARTNGVSFSLFTVKTAEKTAGTYELSKAYTPQQVRLCFGWKSHSSGETGTGNVIGRSIADTAFTRIGATVLSPEGDVYVNNYNYEYASESEFAKGRIKVNNCRLVFGKCPTSVNISSDVIGTSYDVMVYPNDGSAVNPTAIYRYTIAGVQGSLFRVSYDPTEIPANYYSNDFGINMSSELGGISIKNGSTGFFDDSTMNEIEFKWRYSALLVKAYRGEIDPKLKSPTRVPAKFLFDGGHNTIIGQTIQGYTKYDPIDIINASTIFTEDDKEAVMYDKGLVANIISSDDIDVKQAMYDFMVERCYQSIPEDKRPVGPGSGLELNLDAGITNANTAMLMNTSFSKRFDNPNASWDIGGWVDPVTGLSFTYVKKLVDSFFTHFKNTSLNKPYVGEYSRIRRDEYISYFPDIDTTDWELRQLMYNSGGNVWVVNINGDIERKSQRTLYRVADSSDIIQESNMRTLSQLVYLVQNEIDASLLEYDDDGVLKTLQEKINIKFSTWVGNLVQALSIRFQRDKNVDGGDILICYVDVTFRGLILRVPIIVNVQPRQIS